MLFKRLLLSEDENLHICEIVDLLLLISDAAFGHGVVRWTELSMHIVAWHDQILKRLVLCFDVKVTENFDIVAYLVPIEAKHLLFTLDEVIQHRLFTLYHGRKLLKIFWLAETVRDQLLAIFAILLVVKSCDGLNVVLIVLQLLIQVALESESYAQRRLVEIEHLGLVDGAVFYPVCDVRVLTVQHFDELIQAVD